MPDTNPTRLPGHPGLPIPHPVQDRHNWPAQHILPPRQSRLVIDAAVLLPLAVESLTSGPPASPGQHRSLTEMVRDWVGLLAYGDRVEIERVGLELDLADVKDLAQFNLADWLAGAKTTTESR